MKGRDFFKLILLSVTENQRALCFCSLEAVVEDPGPVPLFLYLACTYIHGEVSGSFLVQDIPTCLGQTRACFVIFVSI